MSKEGAVAAGATTFEKCIPCSVFAFSYSIDLSFMNFTIEADDPSGRRRQKQQLPFWQVAVTAQCHLVFWIACPSRYYDRVPVGRRRAVGCGESRVPGGCGSREIVTCQIFVSNYAFGGCQFENLRGRQYERHGRMRPRHTQGRKRTGTGSRKETVTALNERTPAAINSKLSGPVRGVAPFLFLGRSTVGPSHFAVGGGPCTHAVHARCLEEAPLTR